MPETGSVTTTSRMSQKRFYFENPWNYDDLFIGKIKPALNTPMGVLIEGDCLKYLPKIKNDTVDMVFADPPFKVPPQIPGRKSVDGVSSDGVGQAKLAF